MNIFSSSTILFISIFQLFFIRTTVGQFKIFCPPGPEDMLLDSLSSSGPRLILSCDERRKKESESAEICYIKLNQSDSLFVFKRLGEPKDLVFHPHGIDLINIEDKLFLYVISHDDASDKHLILKYEVLDKEIRFIHGFAHALINSPNSIKALADGGFIVTNDRKKRKNILNLLLRKKDGTLVYFDGKNTFKIIQNNLGFPNGIGIDTKQKRLYITTTTQNELLTYRYNEAFELEAAHPHRQLIGGDNIRFKGELLLTTGHPKPMKFIQHMNNKKKSAPSKIYIYDTKSKLLKEVFSDDGTLISAASTALIYKKRMYVSQVFDNFILKIDLKDIELDH